MPISPDQTGEPPPDEERDTLVYGHAANIIERLQQLRRSPEQDYVINRLWQAGFEITTLDVASSKGVTDHSARHFRDVLIFRDRIDQRWVVTRMGEVRIAGRTEWEIHP